MKALYLVMALVTGVALVATSAEAASKKRKVARSQSMSAVAPNSYTVYDFDGEVLGRDPDPFIRLMILREGKPRDQGGPF
jgi:hypothetical protein